MGKNLNEGIVGAAAGNASVSADDGSKPQEGVSTESLLDHIKRLEKEVEETRREAAGYRVRAREAEGKLAQVKTAEEAQAALEEVQRKNRQLEEELQRAKLIGGAQLPEELAEVLHDIPLEKLEKAIEVVKKYNVVDVDPANLRGGLNPVEPEPELDPVKLAEKMLASRY